MPNQSKLEISHWCDSCSPFSLVCTNSNLAGFVSNWISAFSTSTRILLQGASITSQ